MTDTTEVRLIRNDRSPNHLNSVEHVIAEASKISIAVAFLKTKGLEKIVGRLRLRLEADAAVEIFIGSDFCLTEPAALQTLLDLAKRHSALELYLAKAQRGSTFHPKLYMGLGATEARVLLGSANMTGGALTENEELSLSAGLKPGDALLTQLEEVFRGYRSGARFEELDDVVLDRYRQTFKIAQDVKRRVERELAAADSAIFDLARLSALHEEFRQDEKEMLALESRRRDRKRARRVQRQIARMSSEGKLSVIDRALFEKRFRDLVTSGDGHRHLWHSGDIHRRGQAALRQPKKVISLFEMAETASVLSPVEGYARVRASAAAIPGVGINLVSEMLCTFAPETYAVFNGNTAAALRVIGANPPKSVTLFSPEAYGRICGIVEAVRRRIGEEDLSGTDAFLNWIYQRKAKPRRA